MLPPDFEKKAADEKKASDAEHEVTNCNKKILQMEEELDAVTEQLNSSITKVPYDTFSKPHIT